MVWSKGNMILLLGGEQEEPEMLQQFIYNYIHK